MPTALAGRALRLSDSGSSRGKRRVSVAVCGVALVGCGDDDDAATRTEQRPAERVSKLEKSVRADAGVAAKALDERGYEADYSVESLKEVERFFRVETTGPGRARERSVLRKQRVDVLTTIGAYVGEVLRREGGGRYSEEDPLDQGTETLTLNLPDGSQTFPLDAVAKRFRNGPEDDLYFYAEVILEEADP
jgi:hypothetical protein